MKYRYTFPADHCDFRQLLIEEPVEDLDSDGFTAEEQIGERIVSRVTFDDGHGVRRTPTLRLRAPAQTPTMSVNVEATPHTLMYQTLVMLATQDWDEVTQMQVFAAECLAYLKKMETADKRDD